MAQRVDMAAAARVARLDTVELIMGMVAAVVAAAAAVVAVAVAGLIQAAAKQAGVAAVAGREAPGRPVSAVLFP